jgi:hypothetical protein
MIKSILHELLNLFGCFLLFVAVDFKRKPDSSIRLFSSDWFILIGILILAIIFMK